MARITGLLCALAARAACAYHCYSDVALGPVTAADSKGIAIDDNTFSHCPSKIPWVWPNTMQPVGSLRFFKAWRRDWPENLRESTWRKLADYVLTNNAKILMGTQITCEEEEDEQDWQWTKQFLRLFPPSHIMGVAVGNELELLWSKTAEDATVTPACIDGLWAGGGYWRRFTRRAQELEEMGYSNVTLTAVFTGTALGGYPFLEDPNEALVTSFLQNATSTYGQRFAFSFNFYPYFDPSFAMDPNSVNSCETSIARAVCWSSSSCNVPATTLSARRKMLQLTGSNSYTLWLGETGWSSPRASTLHTAMASCDAWSSLATLQQFYAGFLQWDLSVAGARPPEHVFYFTTRNSLNFGIRENFGLIEDCDSVECKIRSDDYRAPVHRPDKHALDWLRWAFLSIGGLVILFIAITCIRVKCMMRRPRANAARQFTNDSEP